MKMDMGIGGQLRAQRIWSSAAKGYGLGWKLCALTMLCGLAIALLMARQTTLSAAFFFASAIIILSSLLRILGCFVPALTKETDIDEKADWPRYTVLVPLYHEAHMVPALMRNLGALDYPRDKLQILMICEGDDLATIEAVERNLRPPFELVRVPASLPRTKPKAMNVAMTQAIGEYITIYDAEDRPHPSQLKAAITALDKRPDWGAVQAPLEYFNADQNWLTRQFALEYAALFHVINPLFTHLGLPFPIGGTSNHFRAVALEEAGLWDPHNVTEDADLAFRFAAMGRGVGMMGYPTQEEAVSEPLNWRNQRTRWIKGFMQSWAVHMREPLRYGWRRFIALQLSLGLTLVAAFLHLPSLVFVTLYLALCSAGVFAWPNLAMGGAVMIFGYAGPLCAAALGAYRARRAALIPQIMFTPLYWLLLFFPAVRAAWQLATNPFYWDKTRHGDSPTVHAPSIKDETLAGALPPI